MKVLVLADSHGRRATLEQVVRACGNGQKIEAVVHLGDHISDARYLRERVRQPVYAVPGNCDWSDEAAEVVVHLGGVRVLLCHGHTLHVKQTLLPLSCRAREAEVRLALFGHTHAPCKEYEDGILLLNPGALKDEKCAVVEIENGEISARLMNIDDLC